MTSKKGAGKGQINQSTLQTLAQLDPDELERLAQLARSLQGGNVQGSSYVANRGAQSSNGRHFGNVKSFNLGKGYGFISCPELHKTHGQDVFLHKNEYGVAGLYEGARVSFGVQMNRGGQPQAVNVELENGKKTTKKRIQHR